MRECSGPAGAAKALPHLLANLVRACRIGHVLPPVAHHHFRHLNIREMWSFGRGTIEKGN
ncbi:hypothetical protein [Frigidibacter sp. ROC022]|uniref:hypothetical protein n=1 Tax=Frigidibacter sp. ROC022 TaxID=2971796 RepID=UPI00215B3B4A|nr:hypothetical protein [Frigidibacter sp. ROC022]MCR8725733.1 hypothetical protein [Frigidibacter sp. ROC022]